MKVFIVITFVFCILKFCYTRARHCLTPASNGAATWRVVGVKFRGALSGSSVFSLRPPKSKIEFLLMLPGNGLEFLLESLGSLL